MKTNVKDRIRRIKSGLENLGWRILTPFLHLYFTEKHFEELYRKKPDPWNYEHYDFEKEKYQKTLKAIPDDVHTVWEVGSSEGVFTQILLEKGKNVLGVDISETALQRARKRVKQCNDTIRLQKLDITREDVDGIFDLILASEILYYLGGKNVLLPLEEKFYRHLRPGGYLLLCHFYPSGKIIHDIFRENNRFQEVFEEVTHHPHRDYIITLLKRQ